MIPIMRFVVAIEVWPTIPVTQRGVVVVAAFFAVVALRMISLAFTIAVYRALGHSICDVLALLWCERVGQYACGCD